ncbi:endogenous retrovirus group k member 5 gag poly [Podarcis lilfordi]|uniref:Endogenous retrovirus group k member 5 gag poly n=1 Tax=Podarcis lilfordi TaxID=74358 RepID=A0AA35K1F6_9SAUR|nr:endogenous retrovirus group k member 5 gag poly [Podarcis lilfordi]
MPKVIPLAHSFAKNLPGSNVNSMPPSVDQCPQGAQTTVQKLVIQNMAEGSSEEKIADTLPLLAVCPVVQNAQGQRACESLPFAVFNKLKRSVTENGLHGILDGLRGANTLIPNLEASEVSMKQLTYENENADCKTVLKASYQKQETEIAQMIKPCQNIDTEIHKSTLRAAALSPSVHPTKDRQCHNGWPSSLSLNGRTKTVVPADCQSFTEAKLAEPAIASNTVAFNTQSPVTNLRHAAKGSAGLNLMAAELATFQFQFPIEVYKIKT